MALEYFYMKRQNLINYIYADYQQYLYQDSHALVYTM